MGFEFRTSTSCANNACVEVGVTPEGVWIRGSEDRSRMLWFTLDEWRAFVKGVRNHEFDA